MFRRRVAAPPRLVDIPWRRFTLRYNVRYDYFTLLFNSPNCATAYYNVTNETASSVSLFVNNSGLDCTRGHVETPRRRMIGRVATPPQDRARRGAAARSDASRRRRKIGRVAAPPRGRPRRAVAATPSRRRRRQDGHLPHGRGRQRGPAGRRPHAPARAVANHSANCLRLGACTAQAPARGRRPRRDVPHRQARPADLRRRLLRVLGRHGPQRSLALRPRARRRRALSPRGYFSDASQRRRRRDMNIEWRRVAAPPRVPHGYSVGTGRGAAAGATWIVRTSRSDAAAATRIFRGERHPR